MNSSDRSINNQTSGSSLFRISSEVGSHLATLRRRKSRSPDARVRSATSFRFDGSGTTKKKGAGFRLSHASSISVADTPATDEMSIDRGRKLKLKTAFTTQSHVAVENIGTSTSHHRAGQIAVKKDKERSESLEGYPLSRKPANTVLEPVVPSKRTDHKLPSDAQVEKSGAVTQATAAEIKRMQRDIETLKKVVHENRRTIKRQHKTIEQLNAQLQNGAKLVSDKEDEIRKLKAKSRKNDELVSSIETNMQCQICMDLLWKPFALPPCGHILCLLCLQEWFRQAPVDQDEMYDDDDDPDYLLNRRKTCPCCRTIVCSRPIPIFLAKTIAASLTKSKGLQSPSSSDRSSRSSPPTDEDPWEGLFPPFQDGIYDDDSDDDEGDGDDDDDDDDDDIDDDDEDDEDEDSEWAVGVFGYGSGSDDPYEGEYVPAQWEPPTVNIHPDIELPQHINMIRRGATREMILTYEMQYTHSEGLVAVVNDANDRTGRVYLGWTIALSEDDEMGQEYMEWVLTDIDNRPERWDVTEMEDGGWIAKKLIQADEVAEYDTTETEAWIDVEDD